MIRNAIAAATALALAACANQAGNQPADATAASTPPAAAAAVTPGADTFSMPSNLQRTPSGLQYVIDQPGTGSAALRGQIVQVHYTGYLTNGTKFDSSRDRGTPYEFPLGAGRVIKGWDEGVAGMKVGERRTLVIPPELAYGSSGFGGGIIPPNATLVFKIELVGTR
jgi:peptidylprolyl isomerase